MKVLALISKEDNICAVEEIIHVCYDSDILDDGTVSELSMQSTDGEWMYIPDLSKKECNLICELLFNQGELDLREYGELQYE